jgi:hypothetical protein
MTRVAQRWSADRLASREHPTASTSTFRLPQRWRRSRTSVPVVVAPSTVLDALTDDLERGGELTHLFVRARVPHPGANSLGLTIEELVAARCTPGKVRGPTVAAYITTVRPSFSDGTAPPACPTAVG